MKKFFLFIITLIALDVASQDSKFSVGLNYPIPFEHNFINDYYNGVIDAEFNFRAYKTNTLSLGLGLNVGLLKSDDSVIEFNVKSYVFQPKIFVEFNFSKLHPYLRLGYSSMVFKTKGRSDEIGGYYGVAMSFNNTQSGLNINPGIKYNIINEFFIQAQYDYILLGVEEPIKNSRYNGAVHIIKIGIGMDL
ncbi:outer membrane beta-barrel protein [Mariniflexile gromovii]|uniref:Outer membrane beta-barrel protein n=1 Tax=Mariniflexile gromovii TaxID=362523 RepID=A0ABS4BYD0_9FLAO|nr:outer membrane beta-barrel protein [Mariniflexile gromovii]MBP0905599.1 outer membrane beta-barrel protein [Mariniflexile gromovii]